MNSFNSLMMQSKVGDLRFLKKVNPNLRMLIEQSCNSGVNDRSKFF